MVKICFIPALSDGFSFLPLVHELLDDLWAVEVVFRLPGVVPWPPTLPPHQELPTTCLGVDLHINNL